jgi:hypothetical protein
MVAFDVYNADHRKWYAEFVKYNTWGKCPVRFLAESLDQDLITHINDKMLHYYIKQEFRNGKVKVKTQSKAKPKSKGASSAVLTKHTIQAQSGKKQTTV